MYVVRLDDPDGEDDDDDEPTDTGKEGQRTPTKTGSNEQQRDRSPSKQPAATGTTMTGGKQRARRRTCLHVKRYSNVVSQSANHARAHSFR